MVIFVDIDDTFVRSYGTKRIPMPSVIGTIRQLYAQGEMLYCWSSGGAEYARASAEEFGIAGCFQAFLPKPDVLLDDQEIADWRHLRQVHPNECDLLATPMTGETK
jgi:hypothetical protein